MDFDDLYVKHYRMSYSLAWVDQVLRLVIAVPGQGLHWTGLSEVHENLAECHYGFEILEDTWTLLHRSHP